MIILLITFYNDNITQVVSFKFIFKVNMLFIKVFYYLRLRLFLFTTSTSTFMSRLRRTTNSNQ
jgi:hypothetical protein